VKREEARPFSLPYPLKGKRINLKMSNAALKDSGKKRVMAVDDDLGILEVIKIILEDKGYDVLAVADGRVVKKRVKDFLPEVILIDLWMSGMDGHEVTRELKKDSSTQHIPVVAISALSHGEKIAKEAGADDFLAKPFNIDDLIALVEKYLLKKQ